MCLVGNGGMDPYSSPYIVPRNSLHNPVPDCLLRTRQMKHPSIIKKRGSFIKAEERSDRSLTLNIYVKINNNINTNISISICIDICAYRHTRIFLAYYVLYDIER